MAKNKAPSPNDRYRRCELYSDIAHLPLSAVQSGIGSFDKIVKYAYVLHDKDKRKESSGKEEEKDRENEFDTYDENGMCNPHFHLLLFFREPVSALQISKAFGVDWHYVKRLGSEVGAMAYLTHSNRPEKFQYPISDVVANFDLGGAIAEQKAQIAKKDAQKAKDARFDDIVSLIERGEMRLYNETDFLSLKEIAVNRHKLDNIYDAIERKALKTKLTTPKQILFVTGPSGAYKTTYVKMLAESRGLDYFVSSSRNDPLDGYAGEPCVILDDLRPGVFSYDTLIKMLDPWQYARAKSRFRNKALLADLIIITATQPLSAFYPFVMDANGVYVENYAGALKDVGSYDSAALESSFQLDRRVSVWVEMTDTDKIFHVWNNDSGCWSVPIRDVNDTKHFVENAGITYYRHSCTDDNLPSEEVYRSLLLGAPNDDVLACIGATNQLDLFSESPANKPE